MKHSKHNSKIARRIATLGIAVLFILGGLFSGAFAPLMRDFVVNAATTKGGANGVANYSISRLPHKNWTVGGSIPIDRPTAAAGSSTVFALYWLSNNEDILVGVGAIRGDGSNTTMTEFSASEYAGKQIHSSLGLKFDRPGTYVYRFYENKTELDNALGLRNDADVQGISFYSYPVTVEATKWNISLPANTPDIVPNIVFPGMAITFPLPESIVDRKGNDLLNFDEEENVTALKSVLDDIRVSLGGTISTVSSGVLGGTSLDTKAKIDALDEKAAADRETLRKLLFAQVKLNFFDGGKSMLSGAATGADTTINNPAARTFTPPATAHGDRFYAEYSINVADISASLSTKNIMVDSTAKTSIDWSASGVLAAQKNNIWFEKAPSISRVPVDSDFDLNIEATLPSPTMNLLARTEIPEDQRASAIEFTNSEPINNYTFITVRFKGTNETGWTHGDNFMWIGEDDASGKPTYHASEDNARRITDFKFTPKGRGEYEFYYYTRTIFGTGRDQDKVVRVDRDGISYIRHTPFDPIKITRDSTRPTIKWTSDFDYVAGATGVDNGNVVTQGAQYLYQVTATKPATQPIRIEEVRQPERAYYGTAWAASESMPLYYVLDGKGQRQFAKIGDSNKIAGTEIVVATALQASDGRVYASSKPNDYANGVAADIISKGDEVRYDEVSDSMTSLPSTNSTGKTSISAGSALVIPAVVGDDNMTKSKDMHYLMTIYRRENGARTGQYITFESGYKLSSTNELISASNSAWNHNETFRIYFDEFNFDNNATTSVEDRLLRSFGAQNFDIAGNYEVWVRCYDNEVGGRNMGTQFNFFFEVKQKNAWSASQPEPQGLFRIGQNDYYKDDTITFAVANFTDTHTDADKIEITYHISFACAAPDCTETHANGQHGHYGYDIGKYQIPAENIVNKRVSLEIKEDNDIGKEIIRRMNNGNHMVEFRIYAVARNYFAIVNGINYEVDGDAVFKAKTPSEVYPVATVYDVVTVYDLLYGEAAKITSSEWDYYFDAQYTDAHGDPAYGDANKLVQQNSRVYLPRFEFEYGTAGIYSSISYEIVQPQGGSVLGANIMDGTRRVGGGWQGLFNDEGSAGKKLTLGDTSKPTYTTTTEITCGDPACTEPTHTIIDTSKAYSNDPTQKATEKTNNFTNRRFFIPTQIGWHTVIVTCTNAGGNVSIFVGQINIKGRPQFQTTLRGTADTADMRIGMVRTLPSVEITINNEVFRSNPTGKDRGTIISTKEMQSTLPGNTTEYPEGTTIGSYTILSGSLNGAAVNWSGNRFSPLYADDYEFEYVISITDTSKIVGTDPFDTSTVHTSKVGGLISSDILINLQDQEYRAFGAQADYTVGKVTNASWRDNTFEQMLVDGASGKTLSMSDDQLFQAMTNEQENYVPKKDAQGNPVAGETVAAPSWKYGKIFIPNFDLDLHPDVKEGLFADFTSKDLQGKSKVESFVTVHFSGQPDGEYLLDTRPNKMSASYTSTLSNYKLNGATYHWFRPYGGKTVPATIAAPVAGGFTDAYGNHYATHPSTWENTDAVDGEYTITYTAIYRNTTATLTYKIAMGDTEAPRINFIDTEEKRLFDESKTVGEVFTFNTEWLSIQGSKTVWTGTEGRDYVRDKLTVLIYNPNGNTVNLSRNSSQTLDDGYYTKTTNERGYDEYSFKLLIAGDYRITFSISSRANVSAVRSKTITVQPEEPEKKIDWTEIMGTILIILSSGLLIGVVIYFIRTGNTTKFQGTHGKKKEKEEKPDAVV